MSNLANQMNDGIMSFLSVYNTLSKRDMDRQQMEQTKALNQARLDDAAFQRQRQEKADYMSSYNQGMDELANDALMQLASGQQPNVDPSVLRRIDPTKIMAMDEMRRKRAFEESVFGGGQGLMSGVVANQTSPSASLPPSSVPAQQGGQAPIWQRQNNPGNLRVPGQNAFQTFPDMQSGLDAYYKQIDRYGQRGLDTIRKIVSTYAPPSENNTEAYIAMVSKASGLGPDDPIDFSNPQQKVAIGKGMTAVEGSGKALTDDMHMRSVGMGPQMAQAGPTTMSDASGRPAAVQGQGGRLQDLIKLPPERFVKVLIAAPKEYRDVMTAMYKQANPEAPSSLREFTAVYGRRPNSPEEYRQFKKGESAGGSAFEGTGMDQQSWSIVNAIGPKIQDGTATPDEQRRYMSAEAHLSTPKVSTDPSTGAQTVMQLDLGQFGFPSLRKQAQQSSVGQQQPQTGYTSTQTTQPKVPEDVRKGLTAVDDILESIDALSKETSGGNVLDNKIPFTERKGRAGSAYTLLQMRLKEALNLGVLNGPDLMILEKMLQDPTSMTAGWSKDSMKGGMDVVRDMFQKKKQSLLAINPGSDRYQRPQGASGSWDTPDLKSKYGLE